MLEAKRLYLTEQLDDISSRISGEVRFATLRRDGQMDHYAEALLRSLQRESDQMSRYIIPSAQSPIRYREILAGNSVIYVCEARSFGYNEAIGVAVAKPMKYHTVFEHVEMLSIMRNEVSGGQILKGLVLEAILDRNLPIVIPREVAQAQLYFHYNSGRPRNDFNLYTRPSIAETNELMLMELGFTKHIKGFYFQNPNTSA